MKLSNYLNTTVSRCTHIPNVDGKVLGIELELEGRNVGLEGVATKGWTRHQDGSLRGESIEFVLAKPLTQPASVTAVELLFRKFADNNVAFNNSIRTSTHVHFNFADKPIRQSITFFMLFTLFEEMMEMYSGEDRGGNLFCLSSRRTDEIANILHRCLAVGNLEQFAGDRYKYAACNLSTLYKFGTVEVRTMRGASTVDQVNKWVAMLNDMYEYSLVLEAPSDLIMKLSDLGGEGLLREIFSADSARELLKVLPEGFDIHRSLLCGARLIQAIAYDYDEDFRSRVEIKEDDGGRLLRIGPTGNKPIVRRLNGRTWTCTGTRHQTGSEFWNDQEECNDCDAIRWNENENCFEEYFNENDEYIFLAFTRRG